jgi:hypothetical protein
MAIMFLGIRLWMAPSRGRGPARGRGRLHARGRARRPVALLFPIALVMAMATTVLVARFVGSPRCSAAAQVSTTEKSLPHGKLTAKNHKSASCPTVVNPLFVR